LSALLGQTGDIHAQAADVRGQVATTPTQESLKTFKRSRGSGTSPEVRDNSRVVPR